MTPQASEAVPARQALPRAAGKRPPAARKKATKPKRRKPNPYLAWAKRLERTRPGITAFTLERLRGLYGPQPWERPLNTWTAPNTGFTAS